MAKKKAISDRQITAAAARLRDALRKNRRILPRDMVEEVLRSKKLGRRLLESFEALVMIARARAETDLRYHRVWVDRNRSWSEALSATGYDMDRVIESVAKTMPRGKGVWTQLVLFNPGRQLTDIELEEEYARLGLVYADPFSLAAANENPNFALEYRNCTHWKDQDRWNRLEFSDNDELDEDVRMTLTASMDYYRPGLWYAGLDL